MERQIMRFLSVAYGVAVVAALSFGVSQTLRAADVCGDDPGEIGTCPPFTNQSCGDECVDRFMSGGQCLQGCCVCAV